MKYFSKKYVSVYFAFLVIGVIGFICLQLDFHTIRKLQAKHRGKGKLQYLLIVKVKILVVKSGDPRFT